MRFSDPSFPVRQGQCQLPALSCSLLFRQSFGIPLLFPIFTHEVQSFSWYYPVHISCSLVRYSAIFLLLFRLPHYGIFFSAFSLSCKLDRQKLQMCAFSLTDLVIPAKVHSIDLRNFVEMFRLLLPPGDSDGCCRVNIQTIFFHVVRAGRRRTY